MYGTSTPSAPRSRACCIRGRSLYPPTRTIDLAPPLAIAANIADNFSYPTGPCCVSTSSQSYPLCANCSATVGLCEFKNNPSFGLPSRISFLNSTPVTTSAIVSSPYFVSLQTFVQIRFTKSPQCNSSDDWDAGPERNVLTCADFSGSVSIAGLQLRQKIKISAGRQRQISQFLLMHRNCIPKPQRQIRQIRSQNCLCFAAQRFALLAIHLHANLIRQRIHSRIAVMPAIRTVGWKPLRRKQKFKNVRVVIRPHPAKQIDLKIALYQIRKQRRRLQRTHFQSNPDVPPLLLQRRANQSRLLVRRRL